MYILIIKDFLIILCFQPKGNAKKYNKGFIIKENISD